jgi:hypothetical protein
VSAKTPGAATRNSPKVIFTVPHASWVKIFSNGSKTVKLAVSVRLIRARNSIGSASRIGCNGSCNSFGPVGRPGGGVKTGGGTGFVCGRAAVGGMMGGGITKVLAAATVRGTGCLAASFSSKWRSKFRRNPANFAFTVVTMTLMARLNFSADRTELILWGKKCATNGFRRSFNGLCLLFFCCASENMSHHWTDGLLFVQIAAKLRQL